MLGHTFGSSCVPSTWKKVEDVWRMSVIKQWWFAKLNNFAFSWNPTYKSDLASNYGDIIPVTVCIDTSCHAIYTFDESLIDALATLEKEIIVFLKCDMFY